jgi:ABC-type amino acid transport substrate-binding protein
MIALSKARIGVAIMGTHTAAYWSKQLNINTEFGAQHSHGYLRVRLLAKHKALLPKINQALAHLHSSGYIKRIEDKYINPIPAQNLRD